MQTQDIPYGCCHCGCGGKTRIATQTRSNLGHIKGEPIAYIKGHARAPKRELAPWSACEVCGKPALSRHGRLCSKHYTRQKRHGSPDVVLKPHSGHGHTSGGISPTYQTWHAMHARCYEPRSRGWANYGERGITVCDRWRRPLGFANFLADMGKRPKGKTLDRIDNDGNYEPGNCRWATPIEQAANKRRNRAKAADPR